MQINNIDEFKNNYDYKPEWFTVNMCSIEVLEYFIKNYDAFPCWWNISIYQKLTEEFIEKYECHMDWWNICKHQIISVQFIEKHIDKIIWFPLCKYQHLTFDFILKYQNRLNFEALLSNVNINLTLDSIEENLYSFNLYSVSIESKNKHIQKLIEKYPYKYEIDKLTHELYEKNNK